VLGSPPLPPFAFSAASDPAAVDGGVRDPYAELPRLGDDDDIAPPRVPAGFTKDDTYLGYFVTTCDMCAGEYRFEGPNVKAFKLGYLQDPSFDSSVTAEKKKAHDAIVDAKVADLGLEPAEKGRKLRGPFPYPDLIFATKATEARPGSVTRWLGARVATLPEEPPVFPLRADVAQHMMADRMPEDEKERISKLPPDERAALEWDWKKNWTMFAPLLLYANVTRDGREIGMVALARGAMHYADGAVARMSTAAFAARVYNDTGMRRMQAKDYATATALFEKAARADPEQSLYSYNLACGLARTHDTRAKDALVRAIAAAREKGPDVKTRATKDPDFESVKSEAWFSDLTR
jgi:hypothetical protein